jgi:uncharacterized lipoprotein YddW (UPF0748 family)
MTRALHVRAIRAAASLVACSLVTAALAQPLRVQQINRTTTGGTVRGYVATVDLTAPGVEIVVTDPLPAGTGYDANLVRTDTWQQTTGVTLAINANFFGTFTTTTADVIGLAISDGRMISPVRQFGINPDPAIIFKNNGTAEIGYIASTQLGDVRDAVAGVGPSTSDSDPGTMLVSDGVNTGATARVQPASRNARTAVGLNQAGTQLYIAVVDLRSNWSVGMTLAELGDFMIERGSHRAVNLDGGGSSSFVYQPAPGATTVVNRPSGGSFRAVANHLGIRVPTPVAAPAPRQIRGAWLRPPGTIAALETTLAQLAAAKVTDLYLETFYHGVSTGRQGVFNARFSFDYLAEAIRAAAKYNIRVHAWLEAGYWQYGTTGAYNFAQNPEWQSWNVATNATGGDGTAGQVFANLVNPGVQAKLRAYCAELAAYTGLWGIQTDYHRFALDNNTSDAYPAPWSYDTWSRSAFQSLYGVDPVTAAATTSGTHWHRFLAWRRAGISAAAREMQAGIDSVNGGIEFSAAMFATAMSSSAQIAKCQDWYTWATNNWVETLVPMAYGSTTSAIQTDIQATLDFAAGKRVVAGLAIIAGTRPTLVDQLNAIKARGVESFVLFDAPSLSTTTIQSQLSTWVTGTSTTQPGDFDVNGYVDARDLTLMNTTFTGTPVTVTTANRRYDLNNDNVSNASDVTLARRLFARHRYGEDGVVDQRDIDALRACFGGTAPVPGVHHLHDLDGDGDVDYADQVILHGLLTVAVSPDLDVNRDGRVTVADAYAQAAQPIDVNRDGVIDALDGVTLQASLRASEPVDLAAPRP